MNTSSCQVDVLIPPPCFLKAPNKEYSLSIQINITDINNQTTITFSFDLTNIN